MIILLQSLWPPRQPFFATESLNARAGLHPPYHAPWKKSFFHSFQSSTLYSENPAPGKKERFPEYFSNASSEMQQELQKLSFLSKKEFFFEEIEKKRKFWRKKWKFFFFFHFFLQKKKKISFFFTFFWKKRWNSFFSKKNGVFFPKKMEKKKENHGCLKKNEKKLKT